MEFVRSRTGPGSILPEADPDPHQNETDPKHWFKDLLFSFNTSKLYGLQIKKCFQYNNNSIIIFITICIGLYLAIIMGRLQNIVEKEC